MLLLLVLLLEGVPVTCNDPLQQQLGLARPGWPVDEDCASPGSHLRLSASCHASVCRYLYKQGKGGWVFGRGGGGFHLLRHFTNAGRLTAHSGSFRQSRFLTEPLLCSGNLSKQ